MPQIVTYLTETIALTSLIVRPLKLTAAHEITLGTVIVCDASGGAFAVTLPPADENPSRILVIKKKDSSANAVTVTRAGSDTIDGNTTFALTAQYKYVTLANDEEGDVWNIIGSN